MLGAGRQKWKKSTCTSVLLDPNWKGASLSQGVLSFFGVCVGRGGGDGQSGIREDKKATNNQDPKYGFRLW